MNNDINEFKAIVEKTLKGQSYDGRNYDNVWIGWSEIYKILMDKRNYEYEFWKI